MRRLISVPSTTARVLPPGYIDRHNLWIKILHNWVCGSEKSTLPYPSEVTEYQVHPKIQKLDLTQIEIGIRISVFGKQQLVKNELSNNG